MKGLELQVVELVMVVEVDIGEQCRDKNGAEEGE